MKTIILLIPVHNGLALTQRAILSIRNALENASNEEYLIKILVIDDGSDDGTGGWIREKYPDIGVIDGDGELWWSGCINAGIEYSKTRFKIDYFLLWNNDLVVGNDYFNNLFRILDEADPNIIVCSKVFYLDQPDKVFSMGGVFDSLSGCAWVINFKHFRKFDLNRPMRIDWFGGMGTLIPKRVIDTTGGFDEINFPQYKGDFDFALRAGKKGFQAVAYPQLEIWNDVSQTGLEVKDLGSLVRSFHDRKSQYNFKENVKFHRRHAHPVFGLYGLFQRYVKLFLKFGISRLQNRKMVPDIKK